ncbi:MAG: LON peptidase substrate-binding domain-containing protein, partial [Halioglobus sp.]|nr:LON peptidase substrate-binding domain-containing protein [Halioglobus sp.]
MGSSSITELPLLPLRDVVVYPHMVLPLFVGREKSIDALEEAMASDKQVLLVAQRNAADDNPGADDMYQVGTVSNILQLLKLPDGTIKVLVEGGYRAAVDSVDTDGPFAIAGVREIISDDIPEEEVDGLLRSTISQFEKYVNLSKKVPSEVLTSLTGIDEPGRLADTIAAHMNVDLEEKQRILEIADIRPRLDHLMGLMEAEIDLFQVEKRIRGRVKKQMEKSQREYYLNEQMKAIQKELGDLDEAPSELDELQARIKEARMPPEASEKVLAELNKLKMMSPMSAEASVVRSYIDWMVSVPWSKRSKVKHDLQRAAAILDEDHYGLEEVKDRIVEYLAVQRRVRKVRGPVLCLVGPPGVGKTSLGESIARATNRKFVRMALGGVRDEAE